MSARVFEAAVAQTLMLPNVEKAYDERTLDAAHRQFKGGVGLRQLTGIAAEQNGLRLRGSVKGNLKEAPQHAFLLRADSGISNVSQSGTPSNVANKFARDSFMGWARRGSGSPPSAARATTSRSPRTRWSAT